MPRIAEVYRQEGGVRRLYRSYWSGRRTTRRGWRPRGVSLVVAVALIAPLLTTGVAHSSTVDSFAPYTDTFGDRHDPVTQPYSDLFQLQWGLENTQFEKDIEARKAWEVTKGKDITVAVIDTGVDSKHPDFAGQLVPGRNFEGGDPNDTTDTANHGTGVAAVIVGAENGPGITGVAPAAKVMPLRAGTVGSVTDAILYAVEKQVDVINISQTSDPSLRLEAAIAAAGAAGIPIVVAAGNRGKNIDDLPVYPASYSKKYPNVIAVTSMDIRGYYSPWANYGRESVTLAAPGHEIVVPTASGRWELATGTSYAAPHVAGVVALMRAANPTYSPERIRDVLREMNTYESTLEPNTLSRGFLNAAAPTRMAASEDPDGTTVTLRPRHQRDLAFQPENKKEDDGTDGVKLGDATETGSQSLTVTRAHKVYHLETADHYGELAMRGSDAALRYFTPSASCLGVCTWKLRMQPDQRSFQFSPSPTMVEDSSFISIVGNPIAGASVGIAGADRASAIELVIAGGRFGPDSVSIHRSNASAHAVTAGRFVEILTMTRQIDGDAQTRWRFTWDPKYGAYRIGSWFDPNSRIVWKSTRQDSPVTGGGWEPNNEHLWIPWKDASAAEVLFNYYEPGRPVVLHRQSEQTGARIDARPYEREVNRYVNDPLVRWSLSPETNDQPGNSQIDGASVTLRVSDQRTTTIGIDSRSLPVFQEATEDPGQIFEIREYHDVAHQLVVVNRFLTYEGGVLRLTPLSDRVNTAWDLVPAGPDRRAYKIRHRQSRLYIAQGARPGLAVGMTENPSSALEFDPTAAHGGLPEAVYTIRPDGDPAYAVTARTNDIETGARVTLMQEADAKNQKWYAKWEPRRGAYLFNIDGYPDHNLAWTSRKDKQIWLYGGSYDDQYWIPRKDRAGKLILSNYADHNWVLTYRGDPNKELQLNASPYDADNHRQRWLFING